MVMSSEFLACWKSIMKKQAGICTITDEMLVKNCNSAGLRIKTRYLFNMVFWKKIVSLCTFDHYEYQVNRLTFWLRLPINRLRFHSIVYTSYMHIQYCVNAL